MMAVVMVVLADLQAQDLIMLVEAVLEGILVPVVLEEGLIHPHHQLLVTEEVAVVVVVLVQALWVRLLAVAEQEYLDKALMEPLVQIALLRQLEEVVDLAVLLGVTVLTDMAAQDLAEIMVVLGAQREILHRKALAVRFVLFGQQAHVHFLQQIQEIYNESLYRN
jgi:hypothetical protein